MHRIASSISSRPPFVACGGDGPSLGTPRCDGGGRVGRLI